MREKPKKKSGKKSGKIKIRKYTWVHPIAGRSQKFIKSRFLCVTNPYRDKKILDDQRKYWRSKYNIEIKGDYLVDVLITKREKEKDDKGERVVSIFKKDPYTFPLEVLRANRDQRGYRIIQD